MQKRKIRKQISVQKKTKHIVEPYPVCKICSHPIKFIVEAISEDNEEFSHFDCVVEKIKEKYNVRTPDTVSYIGQGKFAVVTRQKNREDKEDYTLKQIIPYESSDAFNSFKTYIEDIKQ